MPGTDFGVLTLATPDDYLKAIGLALSLRVSNPGVPTAVACAERLRPLLAPYFDHVVGEKPGLRGFVHKVHLDDYSPFAETMFLDSDILVFKPLRPFIERWGSGPYKVCGQWQTEGVSSFGLDRARVLEKIGKPRLAVIDGAGHGFFRKPGCTAVFDAARRVTADYAAYDFHGNLRYADEDVMAITLTQLDIAPVIESDYVVARYCSAKVGSLQMDATRGLCRFTAADPREGGRLIEPAFVHFAAHEAPLAYTRQLMALYRSFGVSRRGLVALGASDLFESHVRWRAGGARGWVRRLVGA
jgi:hypothetical protein